MRVLEEYEEKFGKYPDVIQFDNGGEFYNQRVLPLLKSMDIRYFLTRLTSKKASIVERLNRSLKTIMWKFFYDSGENKWIGVLDLFVENVNSRKNRTIGMSPDQVSKDNSYEVFAKLYRHAISLNLRKETLLEFLSTQALFMTRTRKNSKRVTWLTFHKSYLL